MKWKLLEHQSTVLHHGLRRRRAREKPLLQSRQEFAALHMDEPNAMERKVFLSDETAMNCKARTQTQTQKLSWINKTLTFVYRSRKIPNPQNKVLKSKCGNMQAIYRKQRRKNSKTNKQTKALNRHESYREKPNSRAIKNQVNLNQDRKGRKTKHNVDEAKD